MLGPDQPLALFMPENLGDRHGKMGDGILRFSSNPVTCVIDPVYAGRYAEEIIDCPGHVPIVRDVAAAADLGAEVLVLGITPSGGLLPEDWYPELDAAIAAGMSIVNGLHNPLAPRYPRLAPGQYVWDIRREPEGIGVGSGRARLLRNTRVLMVGTDMACGKMTAGLLMVREARRRGVQADFVATGQVGITIWGRGVPLDAVKIDYACGAVEDAVMAVGQNRLIVVEGQGSILHPGSSATLPLIRGSCPTHLVLCHRIGVERLPRHDWVRIPPLAEVAALYEEISTARGALPPARTVAVSLNTALLNEEEARERVAAVQDETGYPCTDPVRFGADVLVDALPEDYK